MLHRLPTVAALQAETFCDDVVPPSEAFGWNADRLRDFFEGGGSAKPEASYLKGTSEVPPALATVVASKSLPSSPNTAARPVILLLGDSHTDLGARLNEDDGPGWVALLTRDYQANRQCDVLNRGFSGWNSRWLLSELGKLLSTLPSPAAESTIAVTLLLGSNDHANANSGQHVPLAEYESSMRQIVRQTKQAVPRAQVFVITAPATDEKQWDAYCRRTFNTPGNGRSVEACLPYVEAARRVAQEEGCVLVDLYREMLSTPDYTRFLTDGLHLNAAGNALLHRIVTAALVEQGLGADAIPSHLPHFLHHAFPKMFDRDGISLITRKAPIPIK